jgi:predicted CopG family antitoxin
MKVKEQLFPLTREPYEKLKRKGFAGESFDDVINKLLVQQKEETRK